MGLSTTSLSFQLKRLRKERGLSQRQLAQALDVAVSTISKAENQKNLPSERLLERYSDYFSVPLDSLMASRQTEKIKDLVQKMDYSDDKLDERYREINQETVALNLAYIPYYDSISSYFAKKYRKKIEIAIAKTYSITELFAMDLECFYQEKKQSYQWIGIFQKQAHYKVGDIVAYGLDEQHYGLLQIVDDSQQHRILKSQDCDITVVLSKDLEDEMMGKLIDVQLNQNH